LLVERVGLGFVFLLALREGEMAELGVLLEVGFLVSGKGRKEALL